LLIFLVKNCGMGAQMVADYFAHGRTFPMTTFNPNNSIRFAACAAYRVIAAANHDDARQSSDSNTREMQRLCGREHVILSKRTMSRSRLTERTIDVNVNVM
jgi:hypothetical protein